MQHHSYPVDAFIGLCITPFNEGARELFAVAKGNFVAYYRVSTARQGQSGLGLEAQQQTVMDYLNGGRWKLVADFTEVESGKDDANRPQLEKALRMCRVHRATLIISKLDRLSRDAAWLLGLEKQGYDFVIASAPNVNRLTIGVLALVAEQERRDVSIRTKAALAMAKARGVKLGRPENLSRQDVGSVRGNEAKARIADGRAADLLPVIEDIRAEGATSLRQIARGLTERGIRPPWGRDWTATAVRNLLSRI
jgi:DNA invertase Pin-like site-specific DNA recombinase